MRIDDLVDQLTVARRGAAQAEQVVPDVSGYYSIYAKEARKIGLLTPHGLG